MADQISSNGATTGDVPQMRNPIPSQVQETHIDEDVPQPPLPRSFMPETAEADEGEVTSAPKEGASEAQASCRKVIEDLLRDAMRLTEERIALLLAEMPQTVSGSGSAWNTEVDVDVKTARISM